MSNDLSKVGKKSLDVKLPFDEALHFFDIYKYHDKINNSKDYLNIFADLSKSSFGNNYIHWISNQEDLFSTYIDLKSRIPELYKKDQKESEELSNYLITTDGLIDEQWDVITNVPSRIIEETENYITLECLIDKDSNNFENRKFKKTFFTGVVPIRQLHPVMIKIFERPGEIRYKFIDGRGLFDLNIFEQDYFANLKDNPIFKK